MTNRTNQTVARPVDWHALDIELGYAPRLIDASIATAFAAIGDAVAWAHEHGVLSADMASRRESLAIAMDAGADAATLATLAIALRCARKSTIVLPAHRYEHLSRGRGWARKGTGNNAQCGERVTNGYRVGPGRWIVGARDGFARKDSDAWVVTAVQVGGEVWTVAS